jgi:hypothetical protein
MAAVQVDRAGENKQACWKATRSGMVELAWMAPLATNWIEKAGSSEFNGGVGWGASVGASWDAVGGRSRCQSLPVAEERWPLSRVVPLSWIVAVVASK